MRENCRGRGARRATRPADGFGGSAAGFGCAEAPCGRPPLPLAEAVRGAAKEPGAAGAGPHGVLPFVGGSDQRARVVISSVRFA